MMCYVKRSTQRGALEIPPSLRSQQANFHIGHAYLFDRGGSEDSCVEIGRTHGHVHEIPNTFDLL